MYIQKRKGDNFKPKNMVPAVKHGGGGSIMFWVCFTVSGTTTLLKVDGTMKEEDYNLFKLISTEQLDS